MSTPNKIMLISAQPNEIRIAMITTRNKLLDLAIERPDIEQRKANIYKGRISSIEPSLAAVFVDYGCERHGFLPLKEISPEYFINQSKDNISSADMKKSLKLGQELVVQVEKEERGNKGAALTTFISMAGSYLVLMPNNPRAGGISRRVEAAERAHLKDLLEELQLPESMGVIVRTAGVGRRKEELAWDLDILLSYWEAIKNAAIQKPAPYLIHQESDVVTREIRDYLREDVVEVIIDNQQLYEHVREYVNLVKPDYLPKIKFYQDPFPLFYHYHVEKQIESAYLRELRLPSGGSIVIDQTEALVAIDINSARATKGSDIEETALNTNLEAADEIARQLRLRDIGGLIVIDFIDMSPARNQREVENRLRDALQHDRARIQVGKISRFGLLEMSRQRLAAALNRASAITCPQCHGHGLIRSPESITMSVIHKIQEQLAKTPSTNFELQLPTIVATYMMNEKRQFILNLEKQYDIHITIIPNPYIAIPDYQIKLHKVDGRYNRQPAASHLQIKKPKQDANVADYKRSQPQSTAREQPMINKYLPENFKPAPRGKGGIAKLIQWLVPSSPSTSTATPNKQTPARSTKTAAGSATNKQPARNRSRSGQQTRRGGGQNRSGQGSTASRRNPNHKSSANQSKPSSDRPQNRKPADRKPADRNPADRKPTDRKPDDRKPADRKPTDRKPDDRKPADRKPADRNPADRKPADRKPADRKPDDRKPADSNSEGK